MWNILGGLGQAWSQDAAQSQPQQGGIISSAAIQMQQQGIASQLSNINGPFIGGSLSWQGIKPIPNIGSLFCTEKEIELAEEYIKNLRNNSLYKMVKE